MYWAYSFILNVGIWWNIHRLSSTQVTTKLHLRNTTAKLSESNHVWCYDHLFLKIILLQPIIGLLEDLSTHSIRQQNRLIIWFIGTLRVKSGGPDNLSRFRIFWKAAGHFSQIFGYCKFDIQDLVMLKWCIFCVLFF